MGISLSSPRAAFVLNLVQDINILRPLMVIGARDFGMRPFLLISARLAARDPTGMWQHEIAELTGALEAEAHVFRNTWDAVKSLQGHGIIFAASESNLPNHSAVHDIFRACPSDFRRVTVQHGFECVGYLHSANHEQAHGETASFAADYLCSWTASSLSSMAASQRSKLLVTGPTSVLQQPAGSPVVHSDPVGLVFENLHSVRFRGPARPMDEFFGAMVEFCKLMAPKKVAVRPHPGGQYLIKHGIELPGNAYVENRPAYRLDLRQFQYGISAPSSALIDMLLAGIPTAVWRDSRGAIDGDHYSGLETVTSPSEWADFAAEAARAPAPFIERQQRFLERAGMIIDPQEVYSCCAALFESVTRERPRPPNAMCERHRIQFVAHSRLPTLQLSFEKPLAAPADRGEVVSDLLTEQELRATPGLLADEAMMKCWLEDRLCAAQPTILIFCRYSGPGSKQMVQWARTRNIPIVYHIDDDLLGIPPAIGEMKHAFHNAPERLEAVQYLLEEADLVYCSTERLKSRLSERVPGLEAVAGRIYCSGSILRQPQPHQEVVVGYMASADHEHNLNLVLPAIERLLDTHPHVQFELFGSIPVPASLERFGERIGAAPKVTDYARFLEEFAAREWDVGICPLVPIDFNMMKANTKWVEYSSAGVAVVASRGTVYDECCADGCGLLADGSGEWFEALDRLVRDPQLRLDQVARAQSRVRKEYSLKRLREQVFHVMASATDRASRRKPSQNLEKAYS